MTQKISFSPKLNPSTADRSRFWGGLIFVLLASLWARMVYIHNFEWGYDEGIHVLLSMLLVDGYTPYTELFVSYPPLFVWSLDWPWRFFGTVEAVQIFMSLYALLGVVGVGWVAYRLQNWLAGLLAASLLSFAVIYLDGSRAVMTEVPSVGMAALSVALATGYYWSEGHQRWWWLAASGVMFSASLMLKILSPFLVGLVPLMIIGYHLHRAWLAGVRQPQALLQKTAQPIIVDGLVWTAGTVLPVLLTLLIYDAQEMYRQVIAFRFDTRDAYEEDRTENILMVLGFFHDHIFLSVAALGGIWLTLRQQWPAAWFVTLWLVLALIFTQMQLPLRDKHLPLLLPPLAVLAGVSLAYGLRQLSTHNRQAKQWAIGGVAGLILVGLVWSLGAEYRLAGQSLAEPLSPPKQDLARFIQNYTAPDDCIVTDNPTLAFFADRPVPPSLSEVSSARLRSGYLTYEELVRATDAWDCQIVAPVDKRIKRSQPDFLDWAKANFLGIWIYEGGDEIIIAQKLDNPTPSQPLAVTLGDSVRLLGADVIPVDEKAFYTVNEAPLNPETGPAVYVSLYWEALQTIEQDLTVFVHLRDAQNNNVATADHQPYNGYVPTSRWPVGVALKESVRLALPPDLPSGEYQVIVGLYDPASPTFDRLPVQNDQSGENGVILQTLSWP